MKGFDVLHVKSAVKSRSKMELSRNHLTTMDFGEIVPLFNEEVIPGDKYNVSGEFFSRMAPLVKPTYGKFSFKTVCGFVPYHQVAWDSDAWLAGKTTWEGVTPKGRFITMEELSYFYRTYCLDTGATPTASNCDISWLDSSGNPAYGIFSKEGKYFNKILNALGYAFPQNTNLKTGSAWKTRISALLTSAYPLLAFAKLYNDYMSQSQRYNTSNLSLFLQCVKYDKTVSGYNTSTGNISSIGLVTILSSIKLNYENDYFTSAWQNPNFPLSASEGITSVSVPGLSNDQLSSVYDDNSLITSNTGGGPSAVAIRQRALDFLKSFDDWVRRNNYSGSRAVQQVYSRLGIKTDDYRSHYAHVLSTDTLPIQVGDVTANADTSGASLGSYAGKGVMSGSSGFSIEVSDYGMLFVLGYYTVSPMNPYGFSRSVLRVEPLDYYNPEFDGIGADAISLFEFYENPLGASDSDTTPSDNVFGFTERYNSYRYGRDQITGEFRDYRNNGIMNVWHTGRNLSAVRKAGFLVAQSTSVNTMSQIDSEYNRIFSVPSGDVNHFYLTARFNVSAVRPMMSLNQVPRLGEGDTSLPRNGNVIA